MNTWAPPDPRHLGVRDLAGPDDWSPRVRRWGTLGVLFGVLAVWVGLPLLDRAVSPERPIPPGTTYSVGPVVFTPADGWVLDVDRSGLVGDAPTVTVFTDGARTTVVATPDPRPVGDILAEQSDVLRDDDAVVDVGPESPVTTGGGLDGLQRSFATATGQRRLTVFGVQGWAVIVAQSSFGGPGDDDLTDDLDAMIADLRLGPGGGGG
jgi:hypothetical protein